MLQKISTEKAPAAIGPYSQGIVVNGILFASGQIPINPATGAIEGEDITAQAELVCKNIGALLEAAGTCDAESEGGFGGCRRRHGAGGKDNLFSGRYG